MGGIDYKFTGCGENINTPWADITVTLADEGVSMDDPFKNPLTALDAFRYEPPALPQMPVLRNIPRETAEWTADMMREMVAQQGENLVAVIQEKVRTFEANLQEGESLVVYCDAGKERIRVDTFEFPTWHLAIVSGLNDENNRTHRIENVQDIKTHLQDRKGSSEEELHRIHTAERTGDGYIAFSTSSIPFASTYTPPTASNLTWNSFCASLCFPFSALTSMP